MCVCVCVCVCFCFEEGFPKEGPACLQRREGERKRGREKRRERRERRGRNGQEVEQEQLIAAAIAIATTPATTTTTANREIMNGETKGGRLDDWRGYVKRQARKPRIGPATGSRQKSKKANN